VPDAVILVTGSPCVPALGVAEEAAIGVGNVG
jgi:hypothetical protein